MKRLVYIAMFLSTTHFMGCERLDQEIANIEHRLDMIEGAILPNIDTQLAAINGSIDDLEAVDAELDGYIKALQNTANDLQKQINGTNDALAALESDLEGQISASEQKVLNELNTVKTALEGQLATINNIIATLQAKDAELDQKIADLKTYVDNTLANYATKDWANATFTTLEQYEEMQTAISEINALIKSTQESIATLEEKLNKKIADDIAAAVADVNSDIAAKVTEITNAYTAAIANAKKDITDAYTKALETAIADSEDSMKKWVNETLANGYYDIAEIDAMLTTLESKIDGADADLQKQIEDQRAALEQAKTDLTTAYEAAISEAIETNNGVINAAIAKAIQDVQNKVDIKLAIINNAIAAINKDIEKIKKDIEDINDSIASINEQLAAINGSIDNLKEVDKELDGYIKSLQTTAADLQSQLNATNEKIDNVKKEMGDEIDAVEQNLLNELNKLETYIEGELATINNTIAALQEKDKELDQKIADLRTFVDNELANYATKDWANATFATLTQYLEIQTAIANIESDIKSINEELTNLETRINEKIAADIKAAIDALRTELGDAYKAAIKTAVDEVTNAYKTAIETAKEEIEETYTAAIEAEVNALEIKMQGWVNKQLQQPLKDIADLQAALNALTNEVATDEELAAAVAAQEKALKEAADDLTAAYEKAIENAINENNGKISADIAAAVKTAQDALQEKIDAITDRIDNIEKRLEDLVNSFANRIQSLTYIPEYDDKKIKMDYTSKSSELYFRISPAQIAKLIETNHVTAYARYTTDSATRALNPEFPILVTSVVGDDTGIIHVTIAEDAESPFSDDFWIGDVEAIIYIRIYDGNIDVVSESVSLIGGGYVY